jgi:hypothetical protein
MDEIVDTKTASTHQPCAITIWNLQNGVAPGSLGEVHVIMTSQKQEVFFKHYQVEQPYFVGNRSSKQFHKSHCAWARKISNPNRMPFHTLDAAMNEEYDGCGHCLHPYDNI